MPGSFSSRPEREDTPSLSGERIEEDKKGSEQKQSGRSSISKAGRSAFGGTKDRGTSPSTAATNTTATSRSLFRPDFKDASTRTSLHPLLGKASQTAPSATEGKITRTSPTRTNRSFRRQRSSSSLRQRPSRRSLARLLRGGSTHASRFGFRREESNNDNTSPTASSVRRRADLGEADQIQRADRQAISEPHYSVAPAAPVRPPRSELRKSREKNTARAEAEEFGRAPSEQAPHGDRDCPTTPPRASSIVSPTSHRQTDRRRSQNPNYFTDNRSSEWPASTSSSPLHGFWQPDAAEPTSLPPPPRSPLGSTSRRRAEELRRASQISQLDLSIRNRSASFLHDSVGEGSVISPKVIEDRQIDQERRSAAGKEARFADFAPLTPSSLRSANRQERIAAAATAARAQLQAQAQLQQANRRRNQSTSSNSSFARSSILPTSSAGINRAGQVLVETAKRWSPGRNSNDRSTDKSQPSKELPISDIPCGQVAEKGPPERQKAREPISSVSDRLRFSGFSLSRRAVSQQGTSEPHTPLDNAKRSERKKGFDISTASPSICEADIRRVADDDLSDWHDVFFDAYEAQSVPPSPQEPLWTTRESSVASRNLGRSISNVVHRRAQRLGSTTHSPRRHSIDHSPQSSASSSNLSSRRRNVISDLGRPPLELTDFDLQSKLQPSLGKPTQSRSKGESKGEVKEIESFATTSKRIFSFGFGSFTRRKRADSASTPSSSPPSGSRKLHKAKSKSLGQDPLADILGDLNTSREDIMSGAASTSASTVQGQASSSTPTRARASGIPVAAPTNARLSGPQPSRTSIVKHTSRPNQSLTLAEVPSSEMVEADPSRRSGLPLYRSNSKRESTLDFLEADGGKKSVRRGEGKRAESEASASLRALHQARENGSRIYSPEMNLATNSRPSTSPKTSSSFTSSVRRMFGGRSKSTSQTNRPPTIPERGEAQMADVDGDGLSKGKVAAADKKTISRTDANAIGIGDGKRTKDQLQQHSKPSKGSLIFAPFRAKTPPRPKVDLEGVDVQRQRAPNSYARQSLPPGPAYLQGSLRAESEGRSSPQTQEARKAKEGSSGTSSPPSTPMRRTATASPPRSGFNGLRSPDRSLTLQSLSTAPNSPYSSFRKINGSGTGGGTPTYLPQLPEDLARFSTDEPPSVAAKGQSSTFSDAGTGVALSTSPNATGSSSLVTSSPLNGQPRSQIRASVPKMWQGSRNSASLLTSVTPEGGMGTESEMDTETETGEDIESDTERENEIPDHRLASNGVEDDEEIQHGRSSSTRRYGSSTTTGSISSFKTAKSSPRAQYLEGAREAGPTTPQSGRPSRQLLSLFPSSSPSAVRNGAPAADHSTLSTPRARDILHSPTKTGASPLSDLIHNLEQRGYTDNDSEIGNSSAGTRLAARTARLSPPLHDRTSRDSVEEREEMEQPRGRDDATFDGDYYARQGMLDHEFSSTELHRRRHTFGDEEAANASSLLEARPLVMGSPSSPELDSTGLRSDAQAQQQQPSPLRREDFPPRLGPTFDEDEDDVFSGPSGHAAEPSISVSEIERNLAAVEAALRRHNLEGSFDPASLRRRIVTPRGVSISMFDDEGRHEFGNIEDDEEVSRVTLPPEQESALHNAVKEVRRAISSSQLPQIPNEDDLEGDESSETKEQATMSQLQAPNERNDPFTTPARPSTLEVQASGQSRQRDTTPVRAARSRQESMQDVEAAYARMCDLVGSAAGFAPSPMQDPASSWRRRSTKSQPTQYRPAAESGQWNLSPLPQQQQQQQQQQQLQLEKAVRERTQSAAPAPHSHLFGPSPGGMGGVGSASNLNPRVAARQQLLRDSDAIARASMSQPAPPTKASLTAALFLNLPGLSEEMGEKVQYLRGRTSNLSTGSRRAASESPPRRRPYHEEPSVLKLVPSAAAAAATITPAGVADLASIGAFERGRTHTAGSAKSTKRTSATSATGSVIGTGTSPSATGKQQGTPRSSEMEGIHSEWHRVRNSPVTAARLPLQANGVIVGGSGSGHSSKRASQASSSIRTSSPIVESRATRNMEGYRRGGGGGGAGTRGHVSTVSAPSSQGISALLSNASPTLMNSAMRNAHQQHPSQPIGRDSWRSDWHRLNEHVARPSSRNSMASNAAVAQALAVAAGTNNGSVTNTPGVDSIQGHHHGGPISASQRTTAHASRHSAQLSSLDGSGGHLSGFFDAGSNLGGVGATGAASSGGWALPSPGINGQQSTVQALYRRHALERDSLLDMLQRARFENAELRNRNEQLESDLHQEVTRVLEQQRELDHRREEQSKLETRIDTLEGQLEVEHADRVRIAELLEKVQRALDNAASAGTRAGQPSSPTASSVSIRQEDLQPILSRRMLDMPGTSSLVSHSHEAAVSTHPSVVNGHLDYDDDDDREIMLHDDEGSVMDDDDNGEDDQDERPYDLTRSEDFVPVEYHELARRNASSSSLQPPVESHHVETERSPSLHSYPSALGLVVKDDEMGWQLDDEQAPEEAGGNSEELHHKTMEPSVVGATSQAPDESSASDSAYNLLHQEEASSDQRTGQLMPSSASVPSSIATSQSTSTGSTIVPGMTTSSSRSVEGTKRLPTSPPRATGLAERFGSGIYPKRMPSTTSTAATSLSNSSPRAVSRNTSISSIPQPISSSRRPLPLSPQQQQQQQQSSFDESVDQQERDTAAARPVAMSSADAWRTISGASRVTSGGGNTSAGDTSYTAQTVSPVGSFISTFPSGGGAGRDYRSVSGLPRASSRIVSPGFSTGSMTANKRVGGKGGGARDAAGLIRGGYYDPRRPPDYDPVDVSVLDTLSASGDEAGDKQAEVSM